MWISYSRYTVASCTWGADWAAGLGRQAAVNLSSYSHTRRGTHTHTHLHAQWGTARSLFLFFRELLEIFFKVFPLLLLFCLVFLVVVFLFVFFFLCFSFSCFSSVFGRSAANATERFSVRRVSVGKSKRKAKLKMEIQVRQQQQQREMNER